MTPTKTKRHIRLEEGERQKPEPVSKTARTPRISVTKFLEVLADLEISTSQQATHMREAFLRAIPAIQAFSEEMQRVAQQAPTMRDRQALGRALRNPPPQPVRILDTEGTWDSWRTLRPGSLREAPNSAIQSQNSDLTMAMLQQVLPEGATLTPEMLAAAQRIMDQPLTAQEYSLEAVARQYLPTEEYPTPAEEITPDAVNRPFRGIGWREEPRHGNQQRESRRVPMRDEETGREWFVIEARHRTRQADGYWGAWTPWVREGVDRADLASVATRAIVENPITGAIISDTPIGRTDQIARTADLVIGIDHARTQEEARRLSRLEYLRRRDQPVSEPSRRVSTTPTERLQSYEPILDPEAHPGTRARWLEVFRGAHYRFERCQDNRTRYCHYQPISHREEWSYWFSSPAEARAHMRGERDPGYAGPDHS